MSDADFGGVEPIAVVGLAGRLPGASSVEAFWANQRDGVESVSVLSEAELREAGVDPALLADPDYVRAAGVIEDADRFDAAFFGYSPREAETMDPQQRLFLEVRPSNRGAIALYFDEGFNEIGRRPRYYPGRDGREDALVMAKELLPPE